MKMKSDSACEEPRHTSRTTQNKRTKEKQKPFLYFFYFFVAQNTLLLPVIYGGKCGLLQKMAGNWELQWGGDKWW